MVKAEPYGERASGSRDVGPGQTSGLASIPSRPMGTASGSLMHRTIEQMEVANLDAEIREKVTEAEEAESEQEVKRLEAEVKELIDQKERMKDKIKVDDKKAKEVRAGGGFILTPQTVNDQSWHDARYYAAVKAGASHSSAWFQEKKRRKATLHRKSGAAERAVERKEQDLKWHQAFDSKKVKESEFHDETAQGIETEAIQDTKDGRIRVLTGSAKVVRRGRLKKQDEGRFIKSARTFRKLSQAEVAKFRTETKEDEERVMQRQRVDVLKRRHRRIRPDQKEARRRRVRLAKKRFNERRKQSGEVSLCSNYMRSYCKRGLKCRDVHSEEEREKAYVVRRHERAKRAAGGLKLKEAAEVNSFIQEKGHDGYHGWEKITVNFDTGAAVTAIPQELKEALGLESKEASARNYKTASGELLPDGGEVEVKGLDSEWRGRSISGRLVNVHRLLLSGTDIGRKNCVMLDGDEGTIMPRKGAIARGMQKEFERLKKKHPSELQTLTTMYNMNGIYCFDMWCKRNVQSEEAAGELGPLDSGFTRQAKP